MIDNILMGADNPDGITLEDLLVKLIEEIDAKTMKIIGDTRPEAAHVRTNNSEIVANLHACLSLQEFSMGVLGGMAPNEGPLGKPRIGPGST